MVHDSCVHAAIQVTAAIADLNAEADVIVCANPGVLKEYS